MDWDILDVLSWVVYGLLFGLMICTVWFMFDYYRSPDIYQGTITDFDLSGGGFGNPSLCEVTLDNNRTLAIGGTPCYKMEIGKGLYKRGERWGYKVK